MQQDIDAVLKSMNCIGILVADGAGTIIQVDEAFNEYYGVPARELMHRNVFDLEREGVFRPSSVAMVLRSGREETTLQKVKSGQEVIVTAFPLFDERGKISKVFTFSRDISGYNKFKKMYDDLTRKIAQYDRNLEELSYERAVIEDFRTRNGAFRQVLMSVQRVAKYDINILLAGETGVGKTLLAKKIHSMSNYAQGKFVEINCGAMPENLIESELFGYEKGAFTGASEKGKKGLFEIADAGTLFLDEVSELPLQSQVKLLKVLQDQVVRRIGGTAAKQIRCRLICATNKDLAGEAREGRFRLDLLYRLNAVSFVIPPLRERKEDIIPLSEEFLAKANGKYGLNKIFDPAVMTAFFGHSWPGNTRELENAVHRMAVTTEGEIITTRELPDTIARFSPAGTGWEEGISRLGHIDDLTSALERYEGMIIRSVYERANSSIKLAKALNISQATAARKIRKYIAK